MSKVANAILSRTMYAAPLRGARASSKPSLNCTTPMARSVSCLWISNTGGNAANPARSSSQITSIQLIAGRFRSFMARSRKISAPGAGTFPAFPALSSSLYLHIGPLASCVACEPYQTADQQFTSTSLLRRLLLPWRRRRTLSRFRRRSGPLLLPVVKLLLLLLFVSLLHRSNRLGQWMRPLWCWLALSLLRRTEVSRRLCIPVFRLRTSFRLWIALLLIPSRLRLRLIVVPPICLSKRTESLLRRRCLPNQ